MKHSQKPKNLHRVREGSGLSETEREKRREWQLRQWHWRHLRRRHHRVLGCKSQERQSERGRKERDRVRLRKRVQKSKPKTHPFQRGIFKIVVELLISMSVPVKNMSIFGFIHSFVKTFVIIIYKNIVTFFTIISMERSLNQYY